MTSGRGNVRDLGGVPENVKRMLVEVGYAVKWINEVSEHAL